MIQYGDADAAVVGGTEAALTEFAFACFAAMQALSPTGISRPFDRRRDGFVMGEGAGILVLEERGAARGRAARRSSARSRLRLDHRRPPPDRARARRRGRRRARSSSRSPTPACKPAGLDYVNAHGTSTQLNDAAETAALKRALGERGQARSRSPRRSRRSATCSAPPAPSRRWRRCATLRDRRDPPTLGYEVPDPELDLDYVPGEARPLITGNGAPAAGDLELVCVRRPQRRRSPRGHGGA